MPLFHPSTDTADIDPHASSVIQKTGCGCYSAGDINSDIYGAKQVTTTRPCINMSRSQYNIVMTMMGYMVLGFIASGGVLAGFMHVRNCLATSSSPLQSLQSTIRIVFTTIAASTWSWFYVIMSMSIAS